jgi:Flp pilus assembly CpaF family ATPase
MTTDDRLSAERLDLTSVPLFTQFGHEARITPARPGRVRSEFALPQTALRMVTADDPPTTTSGPATRPGEIDWEQAAALRALASKRLTARLEGEGGAADEQTRRQLGRAVILDVVREATEARFSLEGQAWTAEEQQVLAKAVFDLMFGLGRLQPLVDREDVEDIMVIGHDRVFLNLVDGRKVPGPPVASSDRELVQLLQDLGARNDPPRPFSDANPALHLNLVGARLAASMSVTQRPLLVVRRHRMVRVSLDDLVKLGTVTPVMASFLAAAVRARKSIVVSGSQGDGKTTLLRALCTEIGPDEVIGVFETERELGLEKLTDQHPVVFSWEERPGSGELGPDGKPVNQYSLYQAMRDSFRFILSRQITGEVRGPEVAQMIMAMESGSGSMSTTHAESARQTMEKLISCAVQSKEYTRESAVMKLARCVHLVVQMRTVYAHGRDGCTRKQRVVDEILAIAPGEGAGGYATTTVFGRNGDNPAAPHVMPDDLRDLVRCGFALSQFIAEAHRGGVA